MNIPNPLYCTDTQTPVNQMDGSMFVTEVLVLLRAHGKTPSHLSADPLRFFDPGKNLTEKEAQTA